MEGLFQLPELHMTDYYLDMASSMVTDECSFFLWVWWCGHFRQPEGLAHTKDRSQLIQTKNESLEQLTPSSGRINNLSFRLNTKHLLSWTENNVLVDVELTVSCNQLISWFNTKFWAKLANLSTFQLWSGCLVDLNGPIIDIKQKPIFKL